MTRVLLLMILVLLAGCAESYTIFHSQTGQPIILGRRAYSYEGCLSTMREEATRLGVSLSTVQVRGSWEGRSLLWPFEPGYACEGQSAPNVSHTEFIRTFRPCRLRDSRRSIPAIFDFVRMPKNPGEGFFNSPRELLTIPLLAQYYSTNTTECSLWDGDSWSFSPFLAKGQA